MKSIILDFSFIDNLILYRGEITIMIIFVIILNIVKKEEHVV